jgi:putative ABC transport system substrate-binding protein
VWRIAFLEVSTAESWRDVVDVFRKSFRKIGYTDGANYLIEEHYSGDELGLPAVAQKVVASRPDLILTWASSAALAAKRATNSIPIVFMNSGDPVGWGLVESLSRPGGNVTGVSNLLTEITPKQLELLHEAFPKATKVAVLMNSAFPPHRAALASIQARASSMGITVLVVEASSLQEIDRGFELIARQKAHAVLVMATPFAAELYDQICTFAQRARIPSVGETSGDWVLRYWPRLGDALERSAELVHKILQGAKPAELPVMLPTRFLLAVDLKAARAIGVEIPQSLLIRADRVRE